MRRASYLVALVAAVAAWDGRYVTSAVLIVAFAILITKALDDA